MLVLEKKIDKKTLKEIAQPFYGAVVKLAVDIKKEKITLGCEWHAECQELLIKNGSCAQDIWGANLDLLKNKEDRLEFIALINIKPNFKHYDMAIEDENIKQKIRKVVDMFIE